MTTQTLRLTGTSLLVCLLAAGAGTWIWKQVKPTAKLPTAAAQRGTFSVLVNCRGDLSSRRSAQLTSPLDVTDLQIVWLAPAGGAVKQGAPVIRFDGSKLQGELKEKRAALQGAEATLAQAESQAKITADQDQLDLSSARYAAEKAKLEASKQAILSTMDGEKSVVDQSVAEEKVKVLLASADLHAASARAKIASQTRLRDEAKAEVERTKRRLEQIELKSPSNGIVQFLANYAQGWINAQPFKVGDHVSSGQVLAEIPDLDSLGMESKVDEVDRGRIAVGQAVLIHVDALPESTFHAKLISISPLTEQSFAEWPPVRSFRAFAKIDEHDTRLRPGMNSAADIIEARIPDAISIPAKALFTVNGKPVVYVKTANGFARQPVTVRGRNQADVAVGGLAVGTLVSLTEPAEGGKS